MLRRFIDRLLKRQRPNPLRKSDEYERLSRAIAQARRDHRRVRALERQRTAYVHQLLGGR
jgi:hypothetical protein